MTTSANTKTKPLDDTIECKVLKRVEQHIEKEVWPTLFRKSASTYWKK